MELYIPPPIEFWPLDTKYTNIAFRDKTNIERQENSHICGKKNRYAENVPFFNHSNGTTRASYQPKSQQERINQGYVIFRVPREIKVTSTALPIAHKFDIFTGFRSYSSSK